jgi:hypothetical protein
MKLKKITSLVMLWSMIMMTYTGIVLYISPHGRVAYWTNWELFGWSKDQFADIHTTFMALFIFTTLLHLYYNWKPLTSYMKNQIKEFIFFTKEMLAALSIVLLFLFGTLYTVVPFSTFLEFGDGMKENWVEKSEEPPYGHAEESTLKDFSQKTGYELKQMLKILSEHNITASEAQTLEEIAVKQGKTPGDIFGLITSSLGDNRPENQITGLGRKSFEQIAKELNMDSELLLQELESMGIKAEKKDKFKSTVEKQGFNARELVDGFSNGSLKEK